MLFPTKIAALSTLVAVANAITINTPASLIECQPASITWSDGAAAPYYISIIPGGQASAAALENLPDATSSPVTWTVDIAAGTNVTVKITDGSGNIAYSSPVVIQSGSSTSCLGTNSGSSSSAAASASGSSSGSSASASGSATASASGSASGSSSASASASSAASSGGSSGALATVQGAGVVGVLGAVAAALGIFA
ncbi:hypothetical protein I317_04883 [Kwoniella heveanensis CBS 569]|uniref:Uncharacterized protein n=1 Tax=Kwoniella heveanensis BCC8398 TaxID=1296120 RepID=A0A1B9GH06_9TREE|nr:hypothetical protein I316_08021 [Kwoniella heveanensis BCC8398]OCF41312.1 hypothetical protein I317_04883 [Kwoniella heveanensis CBS 569]